MVHINIPRHPPAMNAAKARPAKPAKPASLHGRLPIIPKDEITYCRQRFLGSGSFGMVYAGKLYGEKVALKFLEKRVDTSQGSFWKELLQEVQMLMGHSHQNVISFKGVCLDPPCIITEYCPKGCLHRFLGMDDYFAQGWGTRLELAIGIAKGMLFLHNQEKPIIHRDLRSPNIVLKNDNTPVITDLGMATHGPMETINGMDPTWQAPEVALKGAKATTKSDVYSFAIIMWEILTGEHPWDGLHTWDIFFELYYQHRPTLPDELPNNWVGVEKYVDLMKHCWAEDPDCRPDFREIVQNLEGIWSNVGLEKSTGVYESLPSVESLDMQAFPTVTDKNSKTEVVEEAAKENKMEVEAFAGNLADVHSSIGLLSCFFFLFDWRDLAMLMSVIFVVWLLGSIEPAQAKDTKQDDQERKSNQLKRQDRRRQRSQNQSGGNHRTKLGRLDCSPKINPSSKTKPRSGSHQNQDPNPDSSPKSRWMSSGKRFFQCKSHIPKIRSSGKHHHTVTAAPKSTLGLVRQEDSQPVCKGKAPPGPWTSKSALLGAHQDVNVCLAGRSLGYV